jgi:hypothetical protein
MYSYLKQKCHFLKFIKLENRRVEQVLTGVGMVVPEGEGRWGKRVGR